jgi:hypothetical protein
MMLHPGLSRTDRRFLYVDTHLGRCDVQMVSTATAAITPFRDSETAKLIQASVDLRKRCEAAERDAIALMLECERIRRRSCKLIAMARRFHLQSPVHGATASPEKTRGVTARQPCQVIAKRLPLHCGDVFRVKNWLPIHDERMTGQAHSETCPVFNGRTYVDPPAVGLRYLAGDV